jgi:hypothetical protein
MPAADLWTSVRRSSAVNTDAHVRSIGASAQSRQLAADRGFVNLSGESLKQVSQERKSGRPAIPSDPQAASHPFSHADCIHHIEWPSSEPMPLSVVLSSEPGTMFATHVAPSTHWQTGYEMTTIAGTKFTSDSIRTSSEASCSFAFLPGVMRA